MDIFISYKAEDYADACWIKSVLEENSISCWLAPNSIPGGSSYAMEIPKAIRECKAFVLLLTKKSQESKWVPRELDQAVNEGKIILPFMLEDFQLQDDFNFYLSNVQRYDAFKGKQKAMERMIKEIKAIVNTQMQNEANTNSNDISSDKTEVNKENKKVISTHQEMKRPKGVTNNKKKGKKPLIITIICLMVIVIAIILASFLSKTTIAGEKISKSTYFVSLSQKEITNDDINKITSLKNLNSASFSECTFEDGALKKLFDDDISIIKIENCGITDNDIQSVNINSNLSSLNLSNNNISSIDFLRADSSKLESLNISSTSVSDISVLSNFNLTSFNANDCKLDNIDALSSNTKLTEIHINNNSIYNIEALSKCNIENIEASNCQLNSINGLENSISLRNLDISNNNISSIEPINSSTIIETINIENNNISDITPLGKSSNKLKKAYLNDNPIESIEILDSSNELTTLDISKTSIENITSLKSCEKLDTLIANNCEIADIDSLENCINLNYIDLSYNKITDISALANINNTSNIIMILNNNKISNLKLPNINIDYINICSNNISDLSAFDGIKVTKAVFDYIDNFDYSKLNNISNIYIVDCPKDKMISISELLKGRNIEYININDALEMNNNYKYNK